METDLEFLFFEDDNIKSFEDKTNPKNVEKDWKLLIVDDEVEVHKVTKLALGKLNYENKNLQFLSAYSCEEAKTIIAQNPDTAVILLDVVMEEDDSGLKFVKYVRENLKNHFVRIILRTGQPGHAPEEKVVLEYDINDYKEKTELTSQKLYSSIISALRTYKHINYIDKSRYGLNRIIEIASEILKCNDLNEFANQILLNIGSILDKNENDSPNLCSGFAAIKKDYEYNVITATGSFSKYMDDSTYALIEKDILSKMDTSINSGINNYFDNQMILFLKNRFETKTIIFYEYSRNLTLLDKELMEVFCSNIFAINEAILTSNRSDDIKNLLNNAGQGFLSFGADLQVNPEYSTECTRIFGQEIKYKNFPELIYNQTEQQDFMKTMLVKILSKTNEEIRNIYLPLLPKEIDINGKSIHLEYKILRNKRSNDKDFYMIILTDISDKKKLEIKIEEERKILKMVVNVFINHDEFITTLKDFKTFCESEIYEILESEANLADIILEILRVIHTFKGNFSQIEMVNITKQLHEFENSLFNFRKTLDVSTIDDFKSFLQEFNLFDWINSDILILNEILGEEFLNKEKVIYVDEVKLIEIENKIKSFISEKNAGLILNDLKKLRLRPFSDLLKPYRQYIEKTSNMMKKSVNPLFIESGNTLINTEKYINFSRSLIHIFKNSIDHGIENPDIRVKNGKNSSGTIKCIISEQNGNIRLTISDDGQGINIEEIKTLSIEKGLCDLSKIRAVSDNELLKHVFTVGLSTKKKVTEFSGRGIGISSVLKELHNLGGSIDIETYINEGTKFIFTLPIYD